MEAHLSAGEDVEVTSQEEGFLGSWYEATIIRPFSYKNRTYLVEYKTLTDDTESQPLREVVQVSNVRPRPPSDDTLDFGPNEDVDVLYNDGWWEGVVVKAVEGKGYVVYFPSFKEEMEFEKSELRHHMEWVDGSWVRSQDREKTEPVELKIDDGNSRGAWFPATVLQEVDNGSFLVEYQTMGPEDNFRTRKFVNSSHIRPSPPSGPVSENFHLLQKVEAFYDFGWWCGVINKVLPDDRYNVFFGSQNKERAFGKSELRDPVEWIDGRWFRDSKEITTIRPNESKNYLNINLETPRTSAEVSESLKKLPMQEYQGRGSSNGIFVAVEAEHDLTRPIPKGKRSKLRHKDPKVQGYIKGNHVSSSFHNKKEKDDFEHEISKNCLPVDSECDDVMEIEPFEAVGFSKVKLQKKQPVKGFSQPMKKPIGGLVTQQMEVGQMDKKTMNVFRRKRGRAEKEEISKASLKGKEHNRRGRPPKAMSLRAHHLSEVSGSKHEESCSKGMTGTLVQTECAATVGHIAKEDLPLSSRRVQREATDSSRNASVEGHEHKRDSGQEMVEFAAAREYVDLSNHTADEHLHPSILLESTSPRGETKGPEPYGASGMEIMDSTALTEREMLSPSAEEILQLSVLPGGDNRGVSPRNHSISNEAITEGGVLEILELQGSESAVECSYSLQNKQMILAGCSNRMGEHTRGKDQNDTALICGATTSIVSSCERDEGLASRSWPFVKSSGLLSMWKNVESMRAFCLIPQQPHFRPLERHCEGVREGLALGYMATFANLVEKTQSATLDETESSLKDKLAALDNLEELGFTVDRIRSRLQELCTIKASYTQLEDDSMAVERRVIKQKCINSKCQTQIEELQKSINEIKQQLQSVTTKKEMQESKVAELKRERSEYRKRSQAVRLDFHRVVTAPW